MRSDRAFTLLELMTAVALIGILAALAVPIVRAATKNANVGSVAWETALELKGLRTRALTMQQDLVLVLVDAQGSDATRCGMLSRDYCTRKILLQPDTGWTFSSFSPSSPGTLATVVDDEMLPRGIRFYLPSAGKAGPSPFDAVTVFDSTLTRGCGPGGSTCIAIRFSGDGEVSAEAPSGSPVSSAGVAFTLTSDLAGQHLAADVRAVLVSFPTGIVRSYSLSL